MIRNLVGSLLKVGLGLKNPSWIQQLLEYKDRTKAAETAKAHGLYFVGVKYEEESFSKSIVEVLS